MKLTEIKLNPKNPRKIEKHKITKLAESIKDFPKMMELRPIVVDKKNVILGGNMRFQALQLAGYEDIPDAWVKVADKLTTAEKKRFVIEDNLSFGEWDWDELSEQYHLDQLKLYGMDDNEMWNHGDMGELAADNQDIEWEGMPEYKSKDVSGYKTLIVHFPDEKAFAEFAELVKQKISMKIKYIWYPEAKNSSYVDKGYKSES